MRSWLSFKWKQFQRRMLLHLQWNLELSILQKALNSFSVGEWQAGSLLSWSTMGEINLNMVVTRSACFHQRWFLIKSPEGTTRPKAGRRWAKQKAFLSYLKQKHERFRSCLEPYPVKISHSSTGIDPHPAPIYETWRSGFSQSPAPAV